MRHSKLFPAILAIAVLSGAWWWKARVELAPAPSRPPSTAVSPANKPGNSDRTELSFNFERLNPGAGSRESLKDLQDKLRSMDSAEAVAWVREFLTSGKDKTTGLAFEIGSDHSLTQWPTFRTFLLDALRNIDPAAAAEISRGVLSDFTTADEWALALRNIGLADSSPETNAILNEKAQSLIKNPAWQADPSVGYLNAFDVFVHTRAVGSAPLLSDLVQRKDRKDLAHAAFLTLDRLVQRAPADMLVLLASDKELQQSRPEMAAQQFARADLRDPAQQAIVRSWLLDPARTGTELHSFAGVYPNNNRFVSNNLLTTEPPQSGSDFAMHDRAALEILHSWSTDPAFTPVKEHLGTMISRLNGFVATPSE